MIRQSILFSGVVLLLLPGTGQAQKYYGNWLADFNASSGFVYAATINDSGNIFGQYCYFKEKSCFWLLAMKTRCNAGNTYVVLVSSDVGTRTLSMYCDGELDNNYFRYVFADFEAVNGLVEAASRIGFAVALKDDQFLVLRFLMEGSAQALATMLKEAEKRTAPTGKGTRDQRM